MTQPNESPDKTTATRSRRDLLRGALRGAALAGVGGLVTSQLVRRRSNAGNPAAHDPCRSDGICARCGQVGQCPQPQAKSYRLETGRRG